jgi:putative tricarboxylic transport membrane protein
MRRVAAPDLGVGIFVLVLAGFALWGTLRIPASPIYAQVGPTVVPAIATGALLVCGLLLTVVALRGGWSHTIEEVQTQAPINWLSFGLLWAGLLANLVLIETLGFVFSGTAMFVLVAAAFGSRRILRDVIVGVLVTFGSYLFFDRALGVNIGAGILEGVL